MRKGWTISLMLMGILTLLLAACAPQLSPVPSTSQPAGMPVPTTVPASNLPPPASQDDAWAKVVQAAKKEGKVNVYSYNMLGDIGVAVSGAFEQKYGIKVEIVTGMGAALSERVLTEQRMKTVVADILDTNSFQTGNAKEAGATIGSSELPALRQRGVWRIEPWASDPEKHIIINTLVYMVSFINTDVVKASDEPKSFRELAQPKWQGKITDTDPRISSGSANFFTTLLQRNLVDQDTVRAIGMNKVNYVSNTQVATAAVIQGRHSLQLMVTPGMYSLALKEVPALPIKPLPLEEGTLVTNRAMAAIKGSPHPNAAKLLMDWLLTQEGQTVFLKAVGLPPVRNDVPDFTPAAMRFTPVKPIAPTLEEERENLRLFREGWLAKLWGR